MLPPFWPSGRVLKLVLGGWLGAAKAILAAEGDFGVKRPLTPVLSLGSDFLHSFKILKCFSIYLFMIYKLPRIPLSGRWEAYKFNKHINKLIRSCAESFPARTFN